MEFAARQAKKGVGERETGVALSNGCTRYGRGVRETEPPSIASRILPRIAMADNEALKIVIEQVRARRDALNSALEVLEGLTGEFSQPVVTVATAALNRPAPREAELQHDTFVGMNVAEAAASYLRMVGRPARPLEEITNALNRGGLNSSQGTVQTLLSRSHNGSSPVVRRAGRGTWGLPEWYQASRAS